jgi:hypothetical protein
VKYQCPHCSTIGTYRNNLRTHLVGNPPGHRLSRADADAIIVAIEAGGTMPITGPAATRAVPVVRRAGPVVRQGHLRSLALLEDTRTARRVLDDYEGAIGHPVYLRPTDGGLTVMSLDPSNPDMVGVGERGDCCISALPGRAEVDASARDYRKKLATVRAHSKENRYVTGLVRKALADGLRLRADLFFLHQQWLLRGSDVIDILAVEAPSGQLVVVEAKRGEAEAKWKRDTKGRLAVEQAQGYVAHVESHAKEFFPFLKRLAVALSLLYRGGEPVLIDPDLPPRWEVWWPDGQTVGSRG